MMIAGQNADEIDQALLSYGMPMGPLELADQIGLDICLDVGERIGVRDDVKKYLKDKIAAQNLGRKTGVGIYQWEGKRALRARADYEGQNGKIIIEALLKPLILACQNCLEEGHVSDADLIDAALIYGIGFPRHTGGPLHAHTSP